MRRIVFALCWMAVTGCGLADIRSPAQIEGDLPANAEQQGRAWLDKAAQAQGGDALAQKSTLSLWMRDDWPSALMRLMAMPWENNKQLLRLDMVVGKDDGRLVFEEGDRKGTGWGIQNWVTYRFDANGQRVFDAPDAPDDTIKFWVPTLAYFPALAWRIRDANYVRYLGDETIGGRTLAVVFATWGEPGPQDTVDQYIVWIDRQTHLVAGVRYTVRDMMASLVGTMKYSDYREVDGVKLPFVINGVKDLSTDETDSHRMVIERLAFDEVPAADLVPRPEVGGAK